MTFKCRKKNNIQFIDKYQNVDVLPKKKKKKLVSMETFIDILYTGF